MEKDKFYRPNVAAIILTSAYPLECKIFLGRRNDMKNVWQFPQGGIDENEKPIEALWRELKEEIGTDELEFIAEFPGWLSYDFPESALKKMKPYIGQKQKYFLVRLKADAKININTKKPEFNDFRFVDVKEIYENIHHFKRKIYLEVLKYFEEKGYI